jgi:hypothetical protein
MHMLSHEDRAVPLGKDKIHEHFRNYYIKHYMKYMYCSKKYSRLSLITPVPLYLASHVVVFAVAENISPLYNCHSCVLWNSSRTHGLGNLKWTETAEA